MSVVQASAGRLGNIPQGLGGTAVLGCPASPKLKVEAKHRWSVTNPDPSGRAAAEPWVRAPLLGPVEEVVKQFLKVKEKPRTRPE